LLCRDLEQHEFQFAVVLLDVQCSSPSLFTQLQVLSKYPY